MANKLDAIELDSLNVDGVGIVRPGMSLEHPMFGLGKVEAIFEFIKSGEITVRVNFKEYGSKAIVPEYANFSLPKTGKAKKSSLFSKLLKKGK
ncbi:hypothetical protein [Microbulbifer sp. JMSA003]|uniref:hypothetical protein n=1 Tax=Microbulbifer sp. JMSA003 TaxID=3243369 RepID=UPI004039EED6